MATLTEVGSVARKGIKIAIIALIALMISPLVAKGIKYLYLRLHPTPPAPPNYKYGALPPIEFPQTADEATPEYSLQTISGDLPALPNIANVYVVGINKYRLLTLDRVKEKVKVLGFTNDPQEISDQIYKFYHPLIPAVLTYNIISGEFSYEYDWTQDKDVPNTTSVSTGEQAIFEAKTFFQSVESLPDDLVNGEGKFSFLAATHSAMIPVDSIYNANFVRADLFRADRDKMKIVTPGGDTSPVNIIFSGLTGGRRVVLANYQYSQVIDGDFGTYPLKSVTTAWQELVAGKGYIAKKTGYKITVRRVSLAYFESQTSQKFLQPVFVFEGDGGFIAYVSAVDSSQTK
jgi:hypothetical protein